MTPAACRVVVVLIVIVVVVVTSIFLNVSSLFYGPVRVAIEL